MIHDCPNCGGTWRCSDAICPFPKAWPCAPKELTERLSITGKDALKVLYDLLTLPPDKRAGAPVDWSVIGGWLTAHPTWTVEALRKVVA